jgi:hypothetical protein
MKKIAQKLKLKRQVIVGYLVKKIFGSLSFPPKTGQGAKVH